MPTPTPGATSPADIMEQLLKEPDERLAAMAECFSVHHYSLSPRDRHLCCAADQILLARRVRMVLGTIGSLKTKEIRWFYARAAALEADALKHVKASQRQH